MFTNHQGWTRFGGPLFSKSIGKPRSTGRCATIYLLPAWVSWSGELHLWFPWKDLLLAFYPRSSKPNTASLCRWRELLHNLIYSALYQWQNMKAHHWTMPKVEDYDDTWVSFAGPAVVPPGRCFGPTNHGDVTEAGMQRDLEPRYHSGVLIYFAHADLRHRA